MGARASRPHPFGPQQPPSRPLVSFVDNPRHSNRPPVIPTAHPSFRRRPESRGARTAGHPTNHKNPTNHSSDNSLRAPSCPSWTIPVIPTAHPSFRRRPESRGAGTWGIPPITKIRHESQFRQLPSRPFVSFVDNPRHSNRPPVIPAAAGIQRGGDVGNPTNHKNHESQFRQPPSRPLVSFVDNPRHSNRPPVIPAAAGIQRGGDVGNPTNHKNHKNHSSDNTLRAPSCPSWTIPVIPTAHPSFRRRPESRGAGTWGIPLITKITRITVQTTPFAPLRALRGQSPSFQPPTRHSGGGRNPEGRGGGTSH